MEPAAASRLNVVPVIPCTAACAAPAAMSRPSAEAHLESARRARRIFVAEHFIIDLLIFDDDFSHLAAEIFGIVRQMIEIGAVEEIGAGWHRSCVQNDIRGLAAAERDGVRLVIEVVAGRITEQPGIWRDYRNGI